MRKNYKLNCQKEILVPNIIFNDVIMPVMDGVETAT